MIRTNILLLTLAVTMCFASCNKYDDEIAAIEERLDKIEGIKITTIEQQIANINTSLTDLKAVDAALQKLIDNLEAEAADLQTKDAELEGKIAALENYVNSEITATEDWANATFATLTQYEGVQTEIAAIKTLIEQYGTDITAAYTKAIADAITASETSMKAWVNGVLADGYYDIAAIDAKLAALETKLADADAELKKQIEDQQAALEQAKKDLTTAYEKAITNAIESNNGIIEGKIAAEVKTAQDALQVQINAINTKITNIGNRLTALETNFANRIQSLTYIPKYTDGKATMTYNSISEKWEAELDFFVTPKSVVKNVEIGHITAKAVVMETRAVNPIALGVTSFSKDTENGTISVTLTGDGLTAGKEYAVFLTIADGNNEYLSDAVSMLVQIPQNSSKQAVANFQEYFCDSDGKIRLSQLDDDNSTTWVGVVMTETKACEIFNYITGLCLSATESYSCCYKSEDGLVEIKIVGSNTPDSNGVYATLDVHITEYPGVVKILLVAQAYYTRENDDTIIPVIIL